MDFPFTGVIAVDKPRGISSRRVVDAVTRALSMRAVGHAGTLDPLASGVMIVCVGHATKLVDHLHMLPKHYSASFLLGRSSPSDDFETPIEVEENPPQPSHDEVEGAANAFRGEILQRPCDYSAVHVDGKRAYRLARKGRTLELEAKRVRIESLVITDYQWPRLAVDVVCSSGTYIRALGRDLAESLGTKAVMESLVRLRWGSAWPLRHSIATPPPATSGRRWLPRRICRESIWMLCSWHSRCAAACCSLTCRKAWSISQQWGRRGSWLAF